jgi:hypothetical protein
MKPINPVVKGSIVKFENGWMEVTAAFKDTVNLGSIHSGKTRLKKIPRSQVYEDGDARWEAYTKSESYLCS